MAATRFRRTDTASGRPEPRGWPPTRRARDRVWRYPSGSSPSVQLAQDQAAIDAAEAKRIGHHPPHPRCQVVDDGVCLEGRIEFGDAQATRQKIMANAQAGDD